MKGSAFKSPNHEVTDLALEEMDLQSHLLKYECHLIAENTTHEELVSIAKELPSDVHLVRYWPKAEARESQALADGVSCDELIAVSAIRAYTMADIFDGLFDAGYDVIQISQGYGRIRPNLINKPRDEEEE